jgi:2-octaprenyl-6-methoxyphenol hydroxylase
MADTDVLIAGGGIVGTVLAAALRQSAPDLRVILIERDTAAATDDSRASAIAAAGKQMLEALGVWPRLVNEAQPINEMIVTDSRGSDVVRPVFLTFDGALEDREPFAHMVPNGALRPAIAEVASAAGVSVVRPDAVTDFTVGSAAVEARLQGGQTVAARVLVAADGVRSGLRDKAGIKTIGWDYPQAGLVATITHERPHHGRAEEHFLPAGPFAVLPLRGNRSSLVWTESRDDAARLMAAPAPELGAEVVKRLGHHLGAVGIDGRLQSYPLGLKVARDFVKPRFCLVGDAAHAIHPLAGQGLNLGLRDAAALAETIIDAHRLGLDIGQLDVLERYQAWRRFDTAEMAALTDGLNRLFSNDNPLVRFARDLGLGMVDRLPVLKRTMIGEAAGRGGEMPRLLRGEAI